MPKPFSLQSPEAIAKEYGGNKQMIAQAMQTGLIDPTAGTLAGMFIDRMRSAQMQEAAPQPTIAQQVFAPPAPPMGGLPPPPGGMGAPPAMSAQPMDAAPAPPMGMADGGLAGIPVPDTMFDEPSNGGFDDGYAHGGIVAFAGGSPGVAKPAPKSDSFYGLSTDIGTNLGALEGLIKPETEFTEREAAYIRSVLDPEAQKKRRDEDKWYALAQLGAKMASTPGSLLQAASAGIGAALPGLQEAAKARRAEEREAVTAGATRELGRNKQQRELVSAALGMVEKAGSFGEAAKTREFQDKWQRMDDQTKRYVAQLSANTQLKVNRERNKSITDWQAKQEGMFHNQAILKANEAASKLLASNPAYMRLTRSKNPEDLKKAAAIQASVRNNIAQGMMAERLAGGDETASPYEGFSAEEVGSE